MRKKLNWNSLAIIINLVLLGISVTMAATEDSFGGQVLFWLTTVILILTFIPLTVIRFFRTPKTKFTNDESNNLQGNSQTTKLNLIKAAIILGVIGVIITLTVSETLGLLWFLTALVIFVTLIAAYVFERRRK